MTLTSGDRALAVERAVSSIEGRYIERRILAAGSDSEAAAVARDECRLWGSSCRDCHHDAHRKEVVPCERSLTSITTA